MKTGLRTGYQPQNIEMHKGMIVARRANTLILYRIVRSLTLRWDLIEREGSSNPVKT